MTACSDIMLWNLLVASSCDIRRQHPATHSAATPGRLAYGTSTTLVSSASTSLRSSHTSPRLRMRSLQFSAASLQTLFILYALPQRSVLALGLPALSVPSSRFFKQHFSNRSRRTVWRTYLGCIDANMSNSACRSTSSNLHRSCQNLVECRGL